LTLSNSRNCRARPSTPIKQSADKSADYEETPSLIERALGCHQQGQLAEAEVLYRQILAQAPLHFDALHLLGVIEHQKGHHAAAQQLMERAIDINPALAAAHSNLGLVLRSLRCSGAALASYDRAIALKPDYVDAYNNRGIALQELQRPDQALASYDRAIALKPDHVEAFNNRGNALYELKRPDEALASYDRAIALKPDYADALNNRGNALYQLKRPDEALASYDRAIALKPDYADAFNNRGNALHELKRPDQALASYDRAIALKPDHADAFNNRGITLQQLKRLDEALASYDRAIAFKLDYADAFNNRGDALRELNRLDKALASYDRAIALEPDYADAFHNRGNALRELKRLDEARASYDRAIALKPDHADAFNNRGIALQQMKRLGEALASYDRAIALKPDYADALKNRGMARLLEGHYRTGWVDYEWRQETKNTLSKRSMINARTWYGEDLTGRRIAIYAEQGLGDVIQFARYLPLLVQRGAKVTFLATAELIRLLRPLKSEVNVVSSIQHGESFDFQCALMSLPLRFGTELSSIPNAVPYLRAEKDLVAQWKRRLGEHGFKIGIAWQVGIAWQGKSDGVSGRGRSFPLAELVPLSHLPGVRLISLQKNHGLDQLASLPPSAKVEILGDEFDSGQDAFIDTAAVMANLDLIITADTSIAHLAGALGRPTWVALKYVPDWRWLLDREDSPWYPTIQLFRQKTGGDWKFVFSRIERELRLLCDDSTNDTRTSFVTLARTVGRALQDTTPS
jgi:tetratricopeptide (TPR) repeat protein